MYATRRITHIAFNFPSKLFLLILIETKIDIYIYRKYFIHEYWIWYSYVSFRQVCNQNVKRSVYNVYMYIYKYILYVCVWVEASCRLWALVGSVTDFMGYSPKNNRFHVGWNEASGVNAKSPFNGVTPL